MGNIAQNADDIEEQRVEAAVSKEENNGGSKFPAMSYEDGVDAALSWVLGGTDAAPMDD